MTEPTAEERAREEVVAGLRHLAMGRPWRWLLAKINAYARLQTIAGQLRVLDKLEEQASKGWAYDLLIAQLRPYIERGELVEEVKRD